LQDKVLSVARQPTSPLQPTALDVTVSGLCSAAPHCKKFLQPATWLMQLVAAHPPAAAAVPEAPPCFAAGATSDVGCPRAPLGAAPAAPCCLGPVGGGGWPLGLAPASSKCSNRQRHSAALWSATRCKMTQQCGVMLALLLAITAVQHTKTCTGGNLLLWTCGQAGSDSSALWHL
jgi:hypothetical protein